VKKEDAKVKKKNKIAAVKELVFGVVLSKYIIKAGGKAAESRRRKNI